MSVTLYSAGSIINYLFGKTAWTNPDPLWIGLALNTIDTVDITYTTASAFTEPSPTTGSYARMSIANDKTVNGFTNAISGSVKNNSTITFWESTDDWGAINYLFITDASQVIPTSDGNVLYWEKLTTPKTIESGTQVVFSGSALTIGINNS